MKIYIVKAEEDYEGSYLVAAYLDKEMAEKRITKLEKLHAKFTKDYMVWAELVDSLPEDAEWPASPEAPEYAACDFRIYEMQVVLPKDHITKQNLR